MEKAVERAVRRRARNRCENCQTPQTAYRFGFPIDHILAKQHGGKTLPSNLALSCLRCNAHKGPNIAGIDTVTKRLVRLFHPRRDRWDEHFRWDDAILIGLTPIARATIVTLAINDSAYVAVGQGLIAEGMFFPSC
jgi:hypothetical protein